MNKPASKHKPNSPATTAEYRGLLADLKQRIRTAQVRTALAANASLLRLYWEIGGVLAERQKMAGWGAAVLPRLAADLHNELPEVKGFSARNLRLMIQFFDEYPAFEPIWQPAVAKLAGKPVGAKKRRRWRPAGPRIQPSLQFGNRWLPNCLGRTISS